MKKKVAYIQVLLLIISCSNNNKVKIHLDKEIVLPGETLNAKLYVNHNDSLAPAYYVVREYDTVRLRIDTLDNDCGIYRAAYKGDGEKIVNGYVDFLDNQNHWKTLHYEFKFDVAAIPTIIPGNKN